MNWYKKAQSVPQITWTLPKTFDPENETVIGVDVKKLDNLWQKDPFYVSPQAGNAGVPGKYEYWKNRFSEGQTENIEMPEIGFYSNEGMSKIIGFKEGRHRFCVVRDSGIERIQVVVPVDQADELLKIIG